VKHHERERRRGGMEENSKINYEFPKFLREATIKFIKINNVFNKNN